MGKLKTLLCGSNSKIMKYTRLEINIKRYINTRILLILLEKSYNDLPVPFHVTLQHKNKKLFHVNLSYVYNLLQTSQVFFSYIFPNKTLKDQVNKLLRPYVYGDSSFTIRFRPSFDFFRYFMSY